MNDRSDRDKPGIVRFYRKLIHLLWGAVLGFQRDQCALRASALSLYTLFAVVPVMAMAFGIAKGFGFQQFFESEVMSLFAGREEIISKVLSFSNNLLERTKGGLMAFLGMTLLLYSLVKLMSHIEATFNHIWSVSESRPWVRKLTDYLTTSLAAGGLVVFSGSVNIFMAGRIKAVSAWMNLPLTSGGLIFPLLSTWLLFMYCYVIMPNTRVPLRAAAAGAFLGGTLFQLIQVAYLKFQVGMASYNAIYGSFAALPLFLIWLQTSWLTLLFGAEFAYAWENMDCREFGNLVLTRMSLRLQKQLLLRIMQLCVKRFVAKEPPLTDFELARRLKLPVPLVRQLLDKLVKAGLLFRVVTEKTTDGQGVTPAGGIESLSVMDVVTAVETQGEAGDDLVSLWGLKDLQDRLDRFETAARASGGDRKIKDL